MRRTAPRPDCCLLAVGLILMGGSLGACGTSRSQAEGASDVHRLRIATSVSPITSIVASIVGDRADVVGMVPEGTNSHTFEPQPSLAELLSAVDVVYLNGLDLETPVRQLAATNLHDGAAIVELGARALTADQLIYDFSFPRADGHPNPHLWTDPELARSYAEIVADDVSHRDPPNADYYAANYRAFSDSVDALDTAMRTAFATVPVKSLLTYHDAYAYFARSYGWSVIGAIQVSDFDDPTPAELAGLIEQVRQLHVPAIFGSEVFPSPVLQLIGEEAGVRYIDELRDDDLPGKPGDRDHSWFGLMRHDFAVMTTGLGGNATALLAVPIPVLAPDAAEYPQ